MKDSTDLADAGQQYATAHAAQYKAENLLAALELHTGVMVAHPNAREAESSRAQILNIVNGVVPKQELLDAQVTLARVHLEEEGPLDVEPARVTPRVLEFPG